MTLLGLSSTGSRHSATWVMPWEASSLVSITVMVVLAALRATQKLRSISPYTEQDCCKDVHNGVPGLQTHFCCAAGCSKDTLDECVRDMVFGLPKAHWSYVKNIVPGWEALLAALKPSCNAQGCLASGSSCHADSMLQFCAGQLSAVGDRVLCSIKQWPAGIHSCATSSPIQPSSTHR